MYWIISGFNSEDFFKGQVTFLRFCPFVMCLALIIPRLTFFQAEKCIYMPVPA